MQAAALQEARIAVLQHVEHALRRQRRLDLARRVVDVLDDVAQLVALLEAHQADLDAARRPFLVGEVADDREDVRVDVVGRARVDGDVLAGLAARQQRGEARTAQEADLVAQHEALDGPADVVLAHDLEAAAHVADEHRAEADAEADQHADQQVGEQDRQHGRDERDELDPPGAPLGDEQRRRRQLEAGDDQHRRQRRQRDAVHQAAEEQHGDGEQHGVRDHRHARATARVDVDRAAHDHRRDRQPADQAGQRVADALRHQLAARVRRPVQRVELHRRLEVEQRLQGRDRGERDGGEQHRGLEHAAEVGPRQQREHAALPHRRDLHHVRGGERPRRGGGRQQFADADANQHGGERPWHRRLLQPGLLPQDQRRERREADEHGAGQRVGDGLPDLGEGVVAVDLGEGLVAFRVGVVAEQVRQLLEDQQQADRREQALDDVVGDEVGDAAAAQKAEGELEHAGDDDGAEEDLEAAEALDLRQHDRREAGGRPRNADLRATERADHDAADDAGDQAGHHRRAGGQGDAQAQRQGDEEDDQPGGEFAADREPGRWERGRRRGRHGQASRRQSRRRTLPGNRAIKNGSRRSSGGRLRTSPTPAQPRAPAPPQRP